MKLKLSIFLVSLLGLSGCISFGLEDVVSDTVDAGKELYQTIRRMANGEEEREYSHSLYYQSTEDDLQQIAYCTNQIRQIIENSNAKLRKVISESSEILNQDETKLVKCTLLVIVQE